MGGENTNTPQGPQPQPNPSTTQRIAERTKHYEENELFAHHIGDITAEKVAERLHEKNKRNTATKVAVGAGGFLTAVGAFFLGRATAKPKVERFKDAVREVITETEPMS